MAADVAAHSLELHSQGEDHSQEGAHSPLALVAVHTQAAVDHKLEVDSSVVAHSLVAVPPHKLVVAPHTLEEVDVHMQEAAAPWAAHKVRSPEALAEVGSQEADAADSLRAVADDLAVDLVEVVPGYNGVVPEAYRSGLRAAFSCAEAVPMALQAPSSDPAVVGQFCGLVALRLMAVVLTAEAHKKMILCLDTTD